MTDDHPDVVIVCDHEIPGGQQDRVATFTWWPDPEDWWPAEHECGVLLTPLTGAHRETRRLGWPPERLLSGYREKPDDEPTLMGIEIPCRTKGCMRRAYRSAHADLQALLTDFVNHKVLRDLFGVSMTESTMTITLKDLCAAHEERATRQHDTDMRD